MTSYLILFVAQTCYIATRAFQQLNVMHHKRVWLFWTSAVMAIFECTVFGSITFKAIEVVDSGNILSFALIVIPLWLGGSLGSLCSMEIHKRLRK